MRYKKHKKLTHTLESVIGTDHISTLYFIIFNYRVSDFETICDQGVPPPWLEDHGIYAIMVGVLS